MEKGGEYRTWGGKKNNYAKRNCGYGFEQNQPLEMDSLATQSN